MDKFYFKKMGKTKFRVGGENGEDKIQNEWGYFIEIKERSVVKMI